MHLNRTTAPTSEPVTWAEFAQHARLVGTDDQAYCEALITAAREYAEAATGLALMTQTWTLKLNNFSNDGFVLRNGVMTLPHPPLASITSIAYVDTGGTTRTLAASTYTANTSAKPGRVYEAYGQVWPATRDIEDAVTVVYVAGYTSAALVPTSIRQAIMVLAAHWYANRESVTTATLNPVPMSVESLLTMNEHGYQF